MVVKISLTSTFSRLPILRYTLLSLTEQCYAPDEIILSLSKEPYLMDDGVAELPGWLEDMALRGTITINWVKNTGPYRKLLPTFESALSDDWIVTCDDDVIYGNGWLQSLVSTAERHPDAIVCGRARKRAYNALGKTMSYIYWPTAALGSTSPDLLPIGIAGVLYRKPLLDSGLMASEDFLDLAPKQDDLWFDIARRAQQTHVVVSDSADKYVFPILGPTTLSASNAEAELVSWDRFFIALLDRFSVKLRGYLGGSVCGNDFVIKKLEKHLRSMG